MGACTGSSRIATAVCVLLLLGVATVGQAKAKVKPVPNDKCSFNTYDAKSWTSKHIEFFIGERSKKSDLEPVLLRNVDVGPLDDLITPEGAAKSLAKSTLAVTWDVLTQSRRGVVVGKNDTTFEEWMHDLTPPFVFNFCQNPICSALIKRLTPPMLRNLTGKPYYSFGSEARGVRLHLHGATWGLVAAGEKRWYLGQGDIKLDASVEHSEQEFASKGTLSLCVQKPGEILVVPQNWYHATFNHGPWSLSIGGQGGNTPEEFSAIFGEAEPELCPSCLALAARSGHEDSVRSMIARRADVNSADPRSGMSALALAASGDQIKVMELLLEAGADINGVGRSGMTTAQAASSQGYVNALDLLIKRKASIQTCMHTAVLSNQLSVVKLLASSGADLQETNQKGYTPLGLAVGAGHAPIVKYLLRKGKVKPDADMLSLAQRKGHTAVARLLQQRHEL